VNSGRPRYDHELLGSSFAHNAELAAVPPPQGPLNIVTPCHGAELWIATEDHEPDHLECVADGCYNKWNVDGTVMYWREDQ